MKGPTFQDVVASTGARLVRGDAAGVVLEGVSTDTRTLGRGELFFGLDGPNFRGADFAVAAIEKGAAALILAADADYESLPEGAVVALHQKPRRALGDLAAWWRSRLSAPVIGITGSCGKTTTKNILRELLSSQLETVASKNSFNNEIGVPLTLLSAEESTEAIVVEIGTNAPGEIAALSRIARPTAGVITNVGAAHLEGLGSLEGVAREKGDLARAVPRDGFVVLNADCRFMPDMRSRAAARVISFSIGGKGKEKGDLDATDLVFHAVGTTFKLEGREVTSPLLGTHNVQNLLAALCVMRGLGYDLDEVLPAVAAISGGPQRMERIELDGLTVFDDTYNSNPDAMRAAVRVLAGMHGFKRRVLVLGDMLELGELAAEMHHKLGREAAERGIDTLILVGDLAKAAAAGALEGGLDASSVIHLASTDLAEREITSLLRDGDVALVKGSRGMHLERLVERLRRARGSA